MVYKFDVGTGAGGGSLVNPVVTGMPAHNEGEPWVLKRQLAWNWIYPFMPHQAPHWFLMMN